MRKKTCGIIGILLFFGLLINACTSASKEQLIPENIGCTGIDTVQVSYSANVLPILQNHCYNCHSAGNFQGQSGVNLEDTSTLKLYALNGKLYGNIRHAPGFNPMPAPPAAPLDPCTISVIHGWILEGAPIN